MIATDATTGVLLPNPTPATSLRDPEMAAARRKLDCAFTNACLTVADRGGWPAMSCEGCGAYVAPDAEQRAADVYALAELAATVATGHRAAPVTGRLRQLRSMQT